MQVMMSHEGSVTVVRPIGAMIAAELDELDSQLQQLARTWVKRIAINLSEVPFVDSAGLELLYRFRRQLNEHGLNVKLCGLNPMTQKIFEITRLSRKFEIFADTATAVRSFL